MANEDQWSPARLAPDTYAGLKANPAVTLSALLVQLLNGLAGASSLFLVGAGLSLIFGVTRIVNFAHGSFYMVGIYTAYSLVEKLGPSIGFCSGMTTPTFA